MTPTRSRVLAGGPSAGAAPTSAGALDSAAEPPENPVGGVARAAGGRNVPVPDRDGVLAGGGGT